MSAKEYPYEEGDIVVLGPETIFDPVSDTIAHKGEVYRSPKAVSRFVSLDDPTPIISSPGGGSWPEPPKVTTAEERLFGVEIAPAIRLLGQGSVAAEDAYSLLCKASHDDPDSYGGDEESQAENERWWNDIITAAWQLSENSKAVYRELAEQFIARQRRWGRTLHEVSVEAQVARRDSQ